MKIATWNVNGIRARQTQVLDWIESDQPDVICLQEIKASPSQVPSSLTELPGYWTYWHGNKGYSGVALLVRKEISAEYPPFAHPSFDFENRIVLTRVAGITVASVYVPNGGKDFAAKVRFLASLDELATSHHFHGDPLVICGDINITRSEIDVHPSQRGLAIGQLPEERAWFENLLRGGLVDLGREHDPNNEALYTWWAPWAQSKRRNIGWRLDYVLASNALAARSTGCSVQREVGTSDHGPVSATFSP